MSSAVLSSRNWVAFKAGPLQSVKISTLRCNFNSVKPRGLATGTRTSDDLQGELASCQRQPTIVGCIEATGVALLASGILAGSCFASDSPESAAQAVQAAKLTSDILRPLFNVFTILYIIRVPMTWYPDIDGKKFPWLFAYVPTEPTLSATRKVVPLVSGVDVSPIVCVGVISFLNEILLGPQGLLTLIQARGGI